MAIFCNLLRKRSMKGRKFWIDPEFRLYTLFLRWKTKFRIWIRSSARACRCCFFLMFIFLRTASKSSRRAHKGAAEHTKAKQTNNHFEEVWCVQPTKCKVWPTNVESWLVNFALGRFIRLFQSFIILQAILLRSLDFGRTNGILGYWSGLVSPKSGPSVHCDNHNRLKYLCEKWHFARARGRAPCST